jgi:hypothetical protein
MSLFKQPESAVGITFMIMGPPGSGKTRFALGAKRVVGRVAYVGTDRGAKFYKDDPEVNGFLQVESRDIDVIRSAIDELTASQANGFGAVVIDTVTDLWEGEQSKFLIQTKKGPMIPLRSWKPLRDGHEKLLRSLQALPVHVFLICEEKPIYVRVGGEEDGDHVELKEIGSREDADKKDSYVSDVRLRFFIDKKTFFCEVLKDRTGTFPMGKVIENPRPEMWLKGAPAAQTSAPADASQGAMDPDKQRKAAEELAAKLMARMDTIKNKHEFASWKKKHTKEMVGLPTDLKEQVFAKGKETAERIAEAPSDEELERAGIPPQDEARNAVEQG